MHVNAHVLQLFSFYVIHPIIHYLLSTQQCCGGLLVSISST